MSKMGSVSDREVLFNTLNKLGDDDFMNFKWRLQDDVVLEDLPVIPKSQLDKADRMNTVDLIRQTYLRRSAEVLKKILKKINRNDLVTELSKARTRAQETDFDMFGQNKCSASVEAPLRCTKVKATNDALKTSSKYDNIISKSLQIQSGSPAVYQLTPKKEKIGTLTKMTLGEKDPNKINKTILLVGETGTGKSTLINALVNYTMGVKWEDDVWFQIVEEEKKRQSESQTSDVIMYQIFGFEDETLPYSLTIIDTPGYGDTRGTEQDDIISLRLFDLFRSDDGVHEINAVGLVLKASENRLSDRLRYIFDSVVSLFGKDMEKNIVALITHSNGRPPKNALKALEAAKIKCARNEKNQPVYFLFENIQNEDRTEDPEELEHADKISTKGLRQFTDFLKKTAPQKLKTTVEVLNERVRLTACIQNLQERIELTEKNKKEIQQILQADEEVDEPYKGKESISGGRWWSWRRFAWFYKGATCCTVCEENCHYPTCTMASNPRECEVMKDGCCTVCTRKCPVSDHVKEEWIYVTKTRKIKMTVEDVIRKYGQGKSDWESVLKNLKTEEKKLQKEQVELLEESFQHVIRLEQIALNVDSLSTHVHLDYLIEKMKEKGDTEKVQKLEEMKSQLDKDDGIRAALRYKQTAADEAAGKAAGLMKN